MPNNALIPALAKTLIAIAWADGELHSEEEATLREVLGLLPAISAQEWGVIEMYLVAPIMPDERSELIQHARSQIRGADDRSIALESVERMLSADGIVHAAEEMVAGDVRAAFEAVDVSPLGIVGRAIGRVFQGRPAREADFELWRTNPVLYVARTRAPGASETLEGSVVELAALAACVMLLVVREASSGTETERAVMRQALVADWHVAPSLAEKLVDAALLLTHRSVDDYRVTRELVERTSEAERLTLLDSLFAIANAADQVAPEEIDEIRVMAGRLNLTRQQFVAAKLKVPSADRGGL